MQEFTEPDIELNEEDLAAAQHEADEDPNIIDPDDSDVEVLDGPEDEGN